MLNHKKTKTLKKSKLCLGFGVLMGMNCAIVQADTKAEQSYEMENIEVEIRSFIQYKDFVLKI